MSFFVRFVSLEETHYEGEPPGLLQHVTLQGGPFATKDEADTSGLLQLAWLQRDVAAVAAIEAKVICDEEGRVVEADDGNAAMPSCLDLSPGVGHALHGYRFPRRSGEPLAAEAMPELAAVYERRRQAYARAELPDQAQFEAMHRLRRKWAPGAWARRRAQRARQTEDE